MQQGGKYSLYNNMFGMYSGGMLEESALGGNREGVVLILLKAGQPNDIF